MILLVSNRSYTDFEGNRDHLIRDIGESLSELGPYQVGDADIGPGADWPMFAITLTAIGSVFLVGEKIDKNLEAWVSIGRKVKKAVSRLKKDHGAVRVDEAGARLLILERLTRDESKILSLEGLVFDTIPIHEFPERPKNELGSRYDALYVLVVRINNDRLYVAGVRSSGEIDFCHSYGAHFMTFGAADTEAG
jgi:hypothetical protein